MAILIASLYGQKFKVETPTIKARRSKKYFRKGKGLVTYTMLANHIPLQVELIGAHAGQDHRAPRSGCSAPSEHIVHFFAKKS